MVENIGGNIPRARAKREHTVPTNVKTTGNIGQKRLTQADIDRLHRARTGPDEMPRPAKKDVPSGMCNPVDGSYPLAGIDVWAGTAADVATLFAPKTQAKQTNPLAKLFGAFTNTNTKYSQVVDMKKVDPQAAAAMTQTVQGLMKTNQPTEVGDAETFANSLIYSMNPKGDGKTVTVAQAMNYIETLDADYKTKDGHEALESMLGELKDSDGNISCEKLKKAFMSAVKDGKTDTESFATALANAGCEKSLVGKDGKAYILQLTTTGIKAYLDDNGKIGQEVPFNQDNFLE